MIRELDSLPCVFRRRGFLAYKANIVGISAPLSGEEELRRFYDKFSEYRNVLRPLCLLLGSQALLGKSTVPMKRDFDALPWPENENDLKLSFWENALCDDIVDYFAEYVRRGQNSHLLREAVLPAQLKKYSDLFVKMLGSVYSNFHQSF